MRTNCNYEILKQVTRKVNSKVQYNVYYRAIRSGYLLLLFVPPGTFDLLGQSHNILHVLGVLATILEMEGTLVDMNVRRERLTSANLALVDFGWTVASPLVVTMGHAVMLIVFSRYVYTHPEIDNPDHANHKHDKMKCH